MTEKNSYTTQIVTFDPEHLSLEVNVEADSVWLTQMQMSKLFQKDQSVIARHIGNIFREGELEEKRNMHFLHNANSDRPVKTYNLDVIISVGYRVKSQNGTRFRIWANKILKQYLLDGVAFNQRRLQRLHQEKLKELEKTINLIQNTITQTQLDNDGNRGLLEVITKYTKTWLLLQKYDEGKITLPKKLPAAQFTLTYAYATDSIQELKHILQEKKEASLIFGQERDNSFESILGSLYQSFANEDLYSSIAGKAAHLLYLIIKDHPFIDGNKRIASFLFIVFLTKNNYNLLQSGEKKITDRTLVAIALLIAQSKPCDKEIMTNLVCRLLTD